jgi:hypothetical protein
MKNVFNVIAVSSLLFMSMGCAHQGGSSGCNGATTHSWKAWVNLMPGADKTVHVTGQVRVNSGGWKAQLVKRVPQGINPDILLLDLVIAPPTGPVTQPVLDLPVHFQEKTSGRPTRVQVFCDASVVADLKVEEVH